MTQSLNETEALISVLFLFLFFCFNETETLFLSFYLFSISKGNLCRVSVKMRL